MKPIDKFGNTTLKQNCYLEGFQKKNLITNFKSIQMKTNVQNRVTNGMFLLNNYSVSKAVSEKYFKNGKQQHLQAEKEASMIESITETIVEPIIFKC